MGPRGAPSVCFLWPLTCPHHSWSTSLFSGTTRDGEFLCTPHPRAGIHHFSKDPVAFQWDVVLRKYLSTWVNPLLLECQLGPPSRRCHTPIYLMHESHGFTWIPSVQIPRSFWFCCLSISVTSSLNREKSDSLLRNILMCQYVLINIPECTNLQGCHCALQRGALFPPHLHTSRLALSLVDCSLVLGPTAVQEPPSPHSSSTTPYQDTQPPQ